MMEIEIKIEIIDHYSPHLESVMKLGRANAKTLGHMPKGGFIDYAMRKHIIIAISPQNKCIGYLMYRVAYQRAALVHLCVDKDWRGNHIAQKLVDELIQITRNLYGIKLTCRRDYNLGPMWSSFGFVALTDKLGRGKGEKLLTVWQLDYEHPSLLTILAQQEIGTKLRTVIDANVFYDLDADNADRQTEDSKSILSDWLQTEVELCLTDEIHNEIDRYEDKARRDKLRKFAETFTRLTCSQEDFKRISTDLAKHFPNQMTVNDASDLRHLARAIAANAQFFVTRDQGILDKEEVIYEEFKTSILRPSDLIIRLDELHREADYQPVRLAGTLIQRRLIQSGQQNQLTELFLACISGETSTEFKEQLRGYISDCTRIECIVVWENRNDQTEPLALIVYDRCKKHELKIPMLRIRRNNTLSSTLLQHLLLLSIKTSAKEGRSFTRITDSYLDRSFISSIAQDNFIKVEDGWLKANLAVAKNASELSYYLGSLANGLPQEYSFCLQVSKTLSDSESIKNPHLMSEFERSFYPAKIVDAEIPTFIIPIRPEWAENLFDEELAKQNIFGAQKELALRREVVYYRSARNSGGLTAPGRILWYVSKGKTTKHYYQTQAVRACSRLDEIIIDTPKNLFRQFRRLGVYSFSDLMSTARNNPEERVMAIKFSDTEIFRSPITLQEIYNILKRKVMLQSPQKISVKDFERLYNKGV